MGRKINRAKKSIHKTGKSSILSRNKRKPGSGKANSRTGKPAKEKPEEAGENSDSLE
jgi:hypothetical protein